MIQQNDQVSCVTARNSFISDSQPLRAKNPRKELRAFGGYQPPKTNLHPVYSIVSSKASVICPNYKLQPTRKKKKKKKLPARSKAIPRNHCEQVGSLGSLKIDRDYDHPGTLVSMEALTS